MWWKMERNKIETSSDNNRYEDKIILTGFKLAYLTAINHIRNKVMEGHKSETINGCQGV